MNVSNASMRLGQIQKGLLNPKLTARFLMNNAQKASKRARSALLRQMFEQNGVHVLDEDWDTLIILDCARYDVFAEMSHLNGSLSKKRSLASVTKHFIQRNFTDKKAHDLVYLSANPVVSTQSDNIDIYKLVGMRHDEAQSKTGQENHQGITDPDPVINRAIELYEKYPNKRHIVHLLPPHVPHICKDGSELASDSPYRNYEAARDGRVDTSVIRDVYAENLLGVVDSIKLLIQKIDGKTVVTADHGELLGEGIPRWSKLLHHRWGNQWHKYDFGHYENTDVSELTDVPWLELPFSTRRQIDSEPPVTDEFGTQDIEGQLESLGYK